MAAGLDQRRPAARSVGMSSLSRAPVPDARARRNLRVLIAATVVLGSQLPVTFILGGLAGQILAPSPCLATLPISVIIFGSMLSAPVLADLMQRRGRALGFVVGAAGGGVGSALCAWGLVRGSFGLFLLGSLLSGLYMSAQGFYRFAATDGASEGFRPKAISYVMAAGLASAVLGPQLVKLTTDALSPVPFAGAYLAAAALNAAGVFIFAFLDSPRPERPRPDGPRARSRAELIRTPRIAVAMVCGMVSYTLMNLVMTSTPLAIVGCGFSTGAAADVVGGHVLAMFAPSFFTGHLIARFGVERVIAAGLVILAAAGVVALSGVTLGHFALALILLGLGWNFGFIGATAMLTAAHSPEERGRVQGMNDFAVFGLVCLGSLASGGLMNCSGGDAVTGSLIARFGAERVIAAGLVILAAAGAVALSGVGFGHFAVAMILLGLGWNFGFIGSTALLASAHGPEERGRVQGMNDFAVFALVALASLASGGLMNCSGGDAVAGWTAVNLAMAPFLAAAAGALIWLAARSRRPRAAG